MRGALRLAITDVQRLPFQFFVNIIAASRLVPRPVRRVLYSMAGLKIRTSNVEYGCNFTKRNVEIGRGTFVNFRCTFDNEAEVVIGNDCAIAMNVLFCTSSHVKMPTPPRAGPPTADPIRVGDGCWIGANAILLPGVVIGEGVIVAAGAVVARSCEPNGLYAGVPARRVRELNLPGDQ